MYDNANLPQFGEIIGHLAITQIALRGGDKVSQSFLAVQSFCDLKET